MPAANIASRKPKIGAQDLARFRESLLGKRVELIDFYRHDIKVGQSATDDNADDVGDRANNAYSRELMFSLSSVEREMVFQVDDALARLDDGRFGTCENCSAVIGLPRLKAVPWARYCIDCQERDERGALDA